MSEKDFLNFEIQKYLQSDLYKIRCKASQYYKNNNDINSKKRYVYIDGVKTVANNLDNNIISHSIFRDLVDQKVNYLLGNDWNVDNEELAKLFNDKFRVVIERATIDAIMYGIGWIFALPDGSFKYIEGINVIPVWEDLTHTNIIKIIRMYTKTEYINNINQKVFYAELWDEFGVATFKKNNQSNVYEEIGRETHLKLSYENQEDELRNWKKIPFIFIKYNQDELSLLVLVKSLIDKMDKTASDTQDLLSDLTNKIGVITGATGTDPKEFSNNKRLYRLAILPDGATYSEIGTDPDITSAKTWIEHLRTQIYIAGRGYDPLQAIGSNASGEARKNLYTNLDLDVNQLEAGVLECFKKCIKFLNNSPILKIKIPEDVKIKFTRNILVNQGEQVDIALKVQQLEGASKELALSISGVTDNPKKEIKKAEEEHENEVKKQIDIFKTQDKTEFINKEE